MPERMPAGMGSPHATPAQSPFSISQISMAFPNIGSYVVDNPKLPALDEQIPLERIVHTGMDRAIREIISPVVERSVTIACMTTRELVTRDYAMESDESRIRHSSNLMVASLAGSLAHVTCKEPLRVAMVCHLKSLLRAFNVTGDVLNQTVSVITNDNIDLGCAVIEQAATEKALHDLEDVIGHSLANCRKQGEAAGPANSDASMYSQGNLARLPEALRPKPGRLSQSQQRVYEDFARLPRQNQSTQNISVATVPSSSSAGSTQASSQTENPEKSSSNSLENGNFCTKSNE